MNKIIDEKNVPCKKRPSAMALASSSTDTPTQDDVSQEDNTNSNRDGSVIKTWRTTSDDGGEPVGMLALLCHQIQSSNMGFEEVSRARRILDKKLTESDMNELTFLEAQIQAQFLTREEYSYLQSNKNNNKMSVKVIMGLSELSEYRMHLSSHR